jgi:hypothetical protein
MKTLLDKEDSIFNPPQLGCVLALTGLPGGNGKIYDRSPYGNHGTITGAIWKKLPSGLWCLSFDGNDDYIDCGSGASLAFDEVQSFSILLWMKAPATGHATEYPRLVRKGNNYYIYKYPGQNKCYFSIHDGAHLGSCQPTGMWDDRWHHLVMVVDRSAQQLYGYVDGWLDAYDSDISNVGDGSGLSDHLFLGSDEAINHDLYGFIGRVSIYNRALSALEIQNRFNREKHLFGVW